MDGLLFLAWQQYGWAMQRTLDCQGMSMRTFAKHVSGAFNASKKVKGAPMGRFANGLVWHPPWNLQASFSGTLDVLDYIPWSGVPGNVVQRMKRYQTRDVAQRQPAHSWPFQAMPGE